MNNRDFLGTEKVSRLVFKLAIPTILAQVVNLLYNIVDRIYIGHISEVGDLALTGVGVCMPVILIISAFAGLIGYGGAPKASIYLGQQKKDKAEIVVGNSFTLLVILGILLTIIISLFKTPLLDLFGASANTISYAEDYLTIYALGSVFVLLALGMNTFITAQGYTVISMLSVIIGAVLNTILDPIFIFLFNMGVSGAAIATVISQAVSSVFIVVFLLSKKVNIRLKWKNLKLEPKIILSALALGLSPFVMQSTEAAISICFNASLETYGGDVAVGAMTILSSLMQFSMLPILGLAQGAQPITSYNFGAKNSSRVKESFKVLFISTLVYSIIFWIMLMIMPGIFASIFTTDTELIAFTKWAIRIYFAVSGLFGIQIACQQTFIAIGNAPISLFLAVLRKIILLIPLIFILPSIIENKTMAVFLAEPIADGIAVTITGIMFYFQFKKILNKMEVDSNLVKN